MCGGEFTYPSCVEVMASVVCSHSVISVSKHWMDIVCMVWIMRSGLVCEYMPKHLASVVFNRWDFFLSLDT